MSKIHPWAAAEGKLITDVPEDGIDLLLVRPGP